MNVKKIIIDRLIRELRDHPQRFECDRTFLLDKDTGYKYYIALMPLAGLMYPYEIGFGFYQSWRFIRAVNRWKAVKMAIEINRCRTGERIERPATGKTPA